MHLYGARMPFLDPRPDIDNSQVGCKHLWETDTQYSRFKRVKGMRTGRKHRTLIICRADIVKSVQKMVYLLPIE